MGKSKVKVTLSLRSGTIAAARTVAPGGNVSAFTDRALRNEILRVQLASTRLPEIPGWLDDAEEGGQGAA
jgi:hypothetical protein